MVSSKALRYTLLAPITVFLLCTSTTLYAEDPGAKIARRGASHPGAVACATCHGADGGGNDEAGFPRLAGLNATYLERQLHAYKKGSNKNPVMSGMASALTDQEITEVAAYYASLQPVSHAKAPAHVVVIAGKHLAEYGDMPARGLPACVQCHGPGGLGVGATFPPLAGQPYNYMIEQFKVWQSGVRSGDPLGMMKHVRVC